MRNEFSSEKLGSRVPNCTRKEYSKILAVHFITEDRNKAKAQKEYQKINEEVRNNDELKDMITKEQALFQMINDVQQAMTKPIGDLYDDLKAK